jgi:hypothetical protein
MDPNRAEEEKGGSTYSKKREGKTKKKLGSAK